MIDIETLEEKLRKDKIHGTYVYCGLEEKLIKDSIELIVNTALTKEFIELNFVKFDGIKAEINDIINACETLPFLSDKKIVLVYRANFLSDKEDRESKKRFEDINKYLENIPEHCIFIMYYIFEEEREKPSDKIKKLEKKCTLIKADKLKGEKFYKKVIELFNKAGKNIGKVELKYFCDNINNNLDVAVSEVNKLVSYCEGRDIEKEDIIKLLPQKNDEDIFDLVDYISQKRPEKAIDILNELLYSGENLLKILSMVQRQFKLLFNIKAGIDSGKSKETLIKDLKLHPYVAEKLMGQSKKFTMKQIVKCLELCLQAEVTFKSTGTEKKTEMELLLINTVRI